MKIDLMNALYTTSMVLLAFVSAIVATKTISRYIERKSSSKKEEE